MQAMVDRIAAAGTALSPDDVVDQCLDLMGPIQVSQATRAELVGHAEAGGPYASAPPPTTRPPPAGSGRCCR